MKLVPRVASHVVLDSMVSHLENARCASLDSTKMRRNKQAASPAPMEENPTTRKQVNLPLEPVFNAERNIHI